MKKTANQILKGALTLGILFIALVSTAQYRLDQANSTMYIDGTSSLHDWTSEVEQMSGTLNAQVSGSEISKITGATMSIPVKSIKSGKGGMDDNTYKALKEPQNPNITYSIKSYAVEGDKVWLTGNLTIAGVTKEVKFQATYAIDGDKIKFEGSHSFNMTDFNVDPPTAVMGTIKTGDKVTIRFNLTYTK